MSENFNHITVLLKETIDQTMTDTNGIYVDCTTGGGGHAEYILSKLGNSGKLIAFDQDPKAITYLEKKFNQQIQQSKLILVNDKFSNIAEQIERLDMVGKIDGIYADLGVSSPQLDEGQRGFSFNHDGPLNMRMDQDSDGFTAEKFVNTADLDELKGVFREYGEEPKAHFVAQAIIEHREHPIQNDPRIS